MLANYSVFPARIANFSQPVARSSFDEASVPLCRSAGGVLFLAGKFKENSSSSIYLLDNADSMGPIKPRPIEDRFPSSSLEPVKSDRRVREKREEASLHRNKMWSRDVGRGRIQRNIPHGG